MPSLAKTNFQENKKDIQQLWTIHEDIAGQGPGRKHGVNVLNRTAIIFITACWESFVEDLAKEAFEFLLTNTPSAKNIPAKVRDFATKPIFDQKNSSLVWNLAEDGWRAVLIAHKNATLERWIGTLNTPKSAQVNSLFHELLGITSISSHWHWQRMRVTQAENKLDNYITIRGNIAHRTDHDETVYRNWGTDYLNHVESLINKTEEAVSLHITKNIKLAPW